MTRPNDPYWPKFLTPRAYDPHEHEDYLRRAAIAYPYTIKDRLDRPIELATFYGPAPFTVEDAIGWANVRAGEVLG
jgi:hypothetical protein